VVGLSYLKIEDVPRISTRKTPLNVAVYAPLAAAPLPPDVVLVRGNAQQLMLLAEAAHAAGVAGNGATMGRTHLRGSAGGDQFSAYRRELRLHRKSRLHRRGRH
jgi:uncharacterized protein (DUF169 family)